MIRKIRQDNTQLWSIIVQSQVICQGFSVDFTETFIYAFLSSTTATLVRFKTLDGSIDIVKASSTISTGVSTLSYSMSLSPTSQTVFFSGNDGTLSGYLWRWNDGSPNFQWALYGGKSPTKSLAPINFNSLYFINVAQTPQNVEFRKVDFANPNFNVWMSQIVWSSWSSTTENEMDFDPILNIIYSLGNRYLYTFCII